ncbi:hypothetical protein T492DRAFT_959127 [Pavlovales sp. CCMP2436]|nr:hypothetical protein T492DRAFT_959127 [Pavlovales sp. CCMP2436]
MANPHSAIALTEGGLKLRIYSTKYAVPNEVKDWLLNLPRLRYEIVEGPILLARTAADAHAAAVSALSAGQQVAPPELAAHGVAADAGADDTSEPAAAPSSPPSGNLSFSGGSWPRIDDILVGFSHVEAVGCCGCCVLLQNYGARKTLTMFTGMGEDKGERFTMQRANVPCWFTLPLLKRILEATIDYIAAIADQIFICFGGTICKVSLQTCVKCATMICNCSAIAEKAWQMNAGNKLVGISLPIFGALPKMDAPRVLKGYVKGTYKLAPPKFPCCFLPCVSPDLDHLVRADYFTLEEPISIEDASLVITVLANMPGLNWSHVERFPKTCSEEHCTPGGSYAFDIDMPKDDMCSDLGLEFPGVPLYTFANEALIAEYDRGVYQYHPLATLAPRALVPAQTLVQVLAPRAPAPQEMNRTVEHPGGFRVVYAASFVEV